LKLQYDETLSNFAFNFNLRRYTPAGSAGGACTLKLLFQNTGISFQLINCKILRDGVGQLKWLQGQTARLMSKKRKRCLWQTARFMSKEQKLSWQEVFMEGPCLQ